jgi:uncharacterized protein (TIGR03083 family)
VEHWTAIADQRRALADQLDGLAPERWTTPSLCEAWTVHDVLAHLVMPLRMPTSAILVAAVRARGSFDRANQALTAREAQRSPDQLVADLHRLADHRFAPPGFGSEAPLADVLVHGEDIRIPLGLSSVADPQLWSSVLDLLMTKRARRGFAPRPVSGIRLRATDIGWSHGDGPEVAGPAAALALAVMGRNARLDRLGGPGVGVLVTPSR